MFRRSYYTRSVCMSNKIETFFFLSNLYYFSFEHEKFIETSSCSKLIIALKTSVTTLRIIHGERFARDGT